MADKTRRFLAVAELSYGKWIFDGNPEELFDVMDRLIPVETDGWGKEAKYFRKDNGNELNVELIKAEQYKFEEVDEMDFLRKRREEAEKRANDLQHKVWANDSDKKKQDEVIESLKEKVKCLERHLCPKDTEPDLTDRYAGQSADEE